MSLETTYELVKKSVPKDTLDSLEVVKQVEEYRQFWKPPKANVILLAESHVYTGDEDFKAEYNKRILDSIVADYPIKYVRFIYCLGYRENDLLNRHLEHNSGTPQFWKIFTSCIAKNDKDLGFQRILKTETPFSQRLRNKVEVLIEMQKKGIWLLDASVVAFYKGVNDREARMRILKTCWDGHIKNMITESHPKHIIVIGIGVKNVLLWKLDQLRTSTGISFSSLKQPQSRGPAEEQLENFRQFQRICSKYCPP